MLLILIGTVLAIAISLAWYLPCVKAQGENRTLNGKAYFRIAMLYGLLFTCILIIITEIIWDGIVKQTPLTGLPKGIVASFFRAALLEELFKFLGFLRAKHSMKLNRKTDYILAAGLIGLVYGVVEKCALGNVAGVIVGLAIPMHITWQLNQGGHFYEYEQHRAAGRTTQARRELFMALAVPFLFHGAWDSTIEITTYFMEKEQLLPQLISLVLGLVTVVFGIIYTIRTIRSTRRIIAGDQQPLPLN